MSEIPENPFTNRRMITKEDEFVGRKREISDILARLRNCNSVSVVGERRIGKSSLLYNLFLTGNKQLGDNEKTRYKFIYLDILSALLSTPSDFSTEVLKALDIDYNKEKLKEYPLKALTRGLQDFNKSSTFPILLIDEFEKLTEKKGIFTDDFFEGLRSCCNSRLLGLVTASQHSLKELTQRNGLTSPLWNIFSIVNLKGFTVDERLNEVVKFIWHFWDRLKPSDEEIMFLLNYPSTHPLVLQVVSFHLYQNRSLCLNKRELKKAIKNELLSYFRFRMEKINRWLKKEGRILERIDWTTEYIGKQIKNLGRIFDFFK